MISCHACGTSFNVSVRVSFLAVCDSCGLELHACLNCRFHDDAVSNQCRESEADLVVDKERANRCEWFQPRGEAASEEEDGVRSREKLEALFRKLGDPIRSAGKQPGENAGNKRGEEKDPRAALDALFKKKD